MGMIVTKLGVDGAEQAFYKSVAMKIFLSHASESKPIVRRLTAVLPKHVEHWLDQDELATGQKFADHIEAGIRNECDFLIAFIDAPALESEWVKREVGLGMTRQRDLCRTFVLPVLIGDVGPRLGELGLAADEWLHLDARDHSDAGVATSAAALQAELFKHASALIEQLRDADRRALIDGFAAELAAFEQVAFRWVASLGNRIDAVAALIEAQNHIRECLESYNDVSDRFVARLPLHRDRLTTAWSGRPSLCNHIAELIDLIEDEVYRGTMFALNEVLEIFHQAMVRERDGELSAEWLSKHEARKTELLAIAKRSLERMTRDASDLAGDLIAELD